MNHFNLKSIGDVNKLMEDVVLERVVLRRFDSDMKRIRVPHVRLNSVTELKIGETERSADGDGRNGELKN